MDFKITTLFNFFYLLMYLVLSIYAATTRRKQKVAEGAGDETLQRASRAHGNFIEFTTIFLFSFLILEINNTNSMYLYSIGTFFLIGRISHAYSMVWKKGLFRMLGMVTTFVSYISNLIYLLSIIL